MTIQEIKNAVDKNHIVHWGNEAYRVIKDSNGNYLIHCSLNDSYIGLTNLSGTELNGDENEFFIKND